MCTALTVAPTHIACVANNHTRNSLGTALALFVTDDVRFIESNPASSHRRPALSFIAPWCADASRIVDVGCGTGFVSYHLGATLDCEVIGVDITPKTIAPIDYRPFDGRWLPFTDASFDAAICTFVLHHSQDAPSLLKEMHRLVRPGGALVVYEDLPTTSWDRLVCRLHDRRWRSRTGPCHFRAAREWAALCTDTGFALRSHTTLSRFRDFTHPVQRCQLVATRVAPRR